MSAVAKALTKIVVCPLCDYMGEDVNKVVDAIIKASPRPRLKCPKCGAELMQTPSSPTCAGMAGSAVKQ
ncbi:hypothetical protein [Vulcanisaeta sp. JCM 16159]|uniref:hypothetical protein n=1 Tax=Vulcanisaeta sp. JCM 16159 TaxID=1295371 RepID=UPI000ACCA311|nr:hypothetical protein [Vulcanisaeta sp. JCM 16159]